MEHLIPQTFLTKPVRILVVGAGGTGSQIITGLARLHHAMLAFGHPYGLSVTLVDDDIVSETNMLRQSFYYCDIGQYKAPTVINRINAAFGLKWHSRVARISDDDKASCEIVIGCVDTRKARKAIMHVGQNSGVRYWLDCGNRLFDGQVCLGEFERQLTKKTLPHIADLYPEMVDPELDDKDSTPSCSLAEALEKQSLLINSSIAMYACNLLFELFRYGKISYHGNYINLKLGRTLPMEIDPDVWKRLGYDPEIKSQTNAAPEANDQSEAFDEELEEN